MIIFSEQIFVIVKVSVFVFQQYGFVIIQVMYKWLFVNEEVKVLFDMVVQELGEQFKCFVGVILVYVQNIDKLQNLMFVVMWMVVCYVEIGVKFEYYFYVVEVLLLVICDVLGEVVIDELFVVWGEVYWFFVEILIGKECELYVEIEFELV